MDLPPGVDGRQRTLQAPLRCLPSAMVSRRAMLTAVPAAAASAATVRPPPLTVFLRGDLMTGRGIDQTLPHPSQPVLCEEFVRVARDYVRRAEAANGRIERPVAFDYIWGDALRRPISNGCARR